MTLFDKLIRFLATGLGLGYAPVAPGTFGTVLGSVLFFLLHTQTHAWLWRFTLAFAVFAIVIAHLAEKSFGSKDCQKIVIDEVAGVLFCYMLVPYNTLNLVMGFILFRLFDVAKIFPANWTQDNFGGGLGVVADDLVAGIQAGLILYYLPQFLEWAHIGTGFLQRWM